MPATRRWAIVGAVAAVSGLGAGSIAVAGAVPAINLNDPATVEPVANANGPFGPAVAVDDSPNQPSADSAGSPSDNRGYPGWVDPSPESADSPGRSAADSPAATAPRKTAADSPAPIRRPAAANSAHSANSPAPVRKVRKAPAADSADSPAVGRSAGSGGSAGSAGSAD